MKTLQIISQIKRFRPISWAFGTLATLVLPTASPAAAVLPDIIVILADDLGYSDLGSQGGEIATPNIDRLAAEGIRFTSASNAARCCPSRASLLTGAYSHRVGHLLDGREILPEFGGLNCDFVNPSSIGHALMAENLAARLRSLGLA
jgi:hypothetical protein